MKNQRIQHREIQKTSLVQKFWLGMGGAAMLSLAIYFAIFLSSGDPENSSASSNSDFVNDELNNGELLCMFTFESGDPVMPDLGVAGIEVNKWVKCLPGGQKGSMGIGSVNSKGDISLVLENSEVLNRDGIDISIDYVRHDKSCSFFTRGKNFDFGIKKGRVFVKMELEDKFGRSNVIEGDSKYLIPQDDQFRNYRFIYNPASGVAEIFVNKIPVWKHKAGENQRLKWDTRENVVIGSGIVGLGTGRAQVDNLIIRATTDVNPLPIELFSFSAKTAEGKVILAWNTGIENGIDHYIIERSTDSENFKIIGMVTSNNSGLEFNNYVYEDFNPSNDLVFYRIRVKEKLAQHRQTEKSSALPTIAYRYKSDLMENDQNVIDSYN